MGTKHIDTKFPEPTSEEALARRIAHELRSPLAAIAATATVLEHELDGISDRGSDLSLVIHRQVVEMSTALDDLLARYGDRGSGLGESRRAFDGETLNCLL